MRVTAERVEVAVGIADVANGKRVNHQTHVGEVGGGDFLDALGEHVPVLIDLLDRHGAADRAEVAFERLEGDVRNLLPPHAQEAFRGLADGEVGALHLGLRDAVHDDGHALFGVDLGRLHFERHQFEGQDVDALEDGPDERAAAHADTKTDELLAAFAVHNGAPATGDHQHLVRAGLDVAAGVDRDEDDDDADDPARQP